MLETAPRIFFTPSLPSGPVAVDDAWRPSACCASFTSAGRSALGSMGSPRSVRITLAVLSISSLALPMASAGSSTMAAWIWLSCCLMAEASVRCASEASENCGPRGVMCPVSSSTVYPSRRSALMKGRV
jgi:hypothetical protein